MCQLRDDRGELVSADESFPDELYVTEPGSSMAPWNVEEDFDHLSEGARVAIYKFAGLATVKVRREALLIDSDDKVLRSKIVEEK